MRRAALRGGCAVRSLGVAKTLAGLRAVGEVDCPDGWAAARMLLALAVEDAQTPGARAIAARLRRGAPSDRAFAEAVQRYVRARVKFAREPGEIFQGTDVTLTQGFGDCDDHARAVYAIATAGGLPALMSLLHAGSDPTHAVAKLCPDNVCTWAETTVSSRLGEHPYAAAERLGLLKNRSDLAREVVDMSESDLKPVPPGYAAANPPETTTKTAEALQRLGYLAHDAPLPCDPRDPVFRAAVLAFQLARSIEPDGLTGPVTRAEVGHAIGELDGAAPAPTHLSAHLSRGFFQKVIAMTERFNAKGASLRPDNFLSVWLFESGIRPAQGNALNAPYFGINMMGREELKHVGFPGSPSEYMALSAEDQLPYVERFYDLNVRSFGKGNYAILNSVGALYLMNFLPALISHAGEESYVLAFRAKDAPAVTAPEADWRAYMKRGHYPEGEKTMWYAWNRGLDFDRKGFIEVVDLTKAVGHGQRNAGAYWLEVRRRLFAEPGGIVSPKVAAIAGSVGILAVVAGAIYEALRG